MVNLTKIPLVRGSMAKNRLKKNSILNFVAVAVLTLVGILLSVCSFTIPYTNTTYNGFANSISLGLDLAGGIYFVYDCSPSEDSSADLNTAIDATVARLESVIGGEYSEAVITRQGSSEIRIEVPSVTDSDEIFRLIGEPTPLYMTLDEYGEERINGQDIDNVYVSFQNNQYGVVIDFTDEGSQKFEELTSDASNNGSTTGNIYIYLGEISDNAVWSTSVQCSEAITGGTTFISGGSDSSNSWSLDDAEEYALRIMSGTFNVEMSLKESSVVSATLGTQALMLCLIGGAVGIVLIMLILWLRYGDFGLLASFALVIYIVLMLFFLQAISFVQLTLPGLAGIMLSIGMAVDGTVIIFEKVREDYRSGKKIPMACRNGFKRAFWPIFDSNITTIISAVVLLILGTSSIQGFATTLLIGIVLSMFMNLVILRFFVKWYLPFNSVKAKPLHLPKQIKPVREQVSSTDEIEVIIEGGAGNE